VAVTYDGTNVHFYINGADAGGSVAVSNTPNITLTGTEYIGILNDASSYRRITIL
jgi:hypothetical protein